MEILPVYVRGINNLILVMDTETLWWTWGMAGRHTEPITSHLIYSNYGLWNDTIDQEIFNTTESNNTWIAAGNSTTSTTLTTDHDIIITIAIATVLGLVILITFCGE
ncbi:hypothetical protein PV328_004684 [Microctonus aethiopoides]|uniref:Uncharacterized protein n=1 Tax=Microctonus aethiopoides TaxID=144406 RepID=A0AA39FB30_9HYME|nr:hypothetical protein PV328_004684 [Microctonus aethiopoides]